MKSRIDETVHNLIGHFETALKTSSEVDVKRLYGAFTMDTVIQVAFGTKVDSLADPNNPVIQNVRKVFSTDAGVKQIATLALLFVFPKIAKMFGIQFQAATMKFFKEFSEQIIKQKKEKLRANKDNYGK